MTPKVKVLFVCVGNCVRSQMAEAIARRDAADVITAESAGIHPLGFIDPTAKAVLAERNFSIDGQFSKGLRDPSLAVPDLIINMSGLPCKTHFQHQPFEDWHVKDPFGENMETHRRICDDIERRVSDLAQHLRAKTSVEPQRRRDTQQQT